MNMMFVYLSVCICTVASAAVLTTFAGHTSIEAVCGKTYNESLQLEVDFEIDNAESGVDE